MATVFFKSMKQKLQDNIFYKLEWFLFFANNFVQSTNSIVLQNNNVHFFVGR